MNVHQFLFYWFWRWLKPEFGDGISERKNFSHGESALFIERPAAVHTETGKGEEDCDTSDSGIHRRHPSGRRAGSAVCRDWVIQNPCVPGECRTELRLTGRVKEHCGKAAADKAADPAVQGYIFLPFIWV